MGRARSELRSLCCHDFFKERWQTPPTGTPWRVSFSYSFMLIYTLIFFSIRSFKFQRFAKYANLCPPQSQLKCFYQAGFTPVSCLTVFPIQVWAFSCLWLVKKHSSAQVPGETVYFQAKTGLGSPEVSWHQGVLPGLSETCPDHNTSVWSLDPKLKTKQNNSKTNKHLFSPSPNFPRMVLGKILGLFDIFIFRLDTMFYGVNRKRNNQHFQQFLPSSKVSRKKYCFYWRRISDP